MYKVKILSLTKARIIRTDGAPSRLSNFTASPAVCKAAAAALNRYFSA